jgi:hypothetical protein
VDNYIPFVSEEPPRRRRRPGPILVTAAGMAALLTIGAFAISALVGGGGSDSPEGAVRQLAEAVSHEDALAAADVLAPGEVRSLHGTVEAAIHKAAELHAVDASAAPLRGVDFSVNDLQLSSERLGDDVVKVRIDRGHMSARTERRLLSALLQKVVPEDSDGVRTVDLARLAHNEPTFLVTVRRDGKWYVSVAGTILEYVRMNENGPSPDFASPPPGTLGADSPDAAVQDGLHAIASRNWDRLLVLVSPEEAPLYAYRATLDRSIGDSQSTFTVDQLTTSSVVDGDVAHVTVHALGSTDSGPWSWDGGCITGTSDGERQTICVPARFSLIRLFFGYESQPEPGAPSEITVIRRDGRWFVSPVGTALDVLDVWIQRFDQRTLYSLLNLSYLLPPDGAITLGRALRIPASDDVDHVYALAGHADERIVARLDTATTRQDVLGAGEVSVFGPDDKPVAEDVLFDGEPVVLPRDGTYTVVAHVYAPGDATLTIWDEASAPRGVFHPPESDIYGGDAGLGSNTGVEQCTRDPLGLGETCSSSSVTTAP